MMAPPEELSLREPDLIAVSYCLSMSCLADLTLFDCVYCSCLSWNGPRVLMIDLALDWRYAQIYASVEVIY